MNISVLRCLAEAYLAAVDGSTRDAELRGLRNLLHTWWGTKHHGFKDQLSVISALSHIAETLWTPRLLAEPDGKTHTLSPSHSVSC